MYTVHVRTKSTDVTMTSSYCVEIFIFYADIPDVLNTAPGQYNLLKLLADMDHQLSVPYHVLSGLQTSPEANKVKLSQVIHTWLTSQPSPVTWETVISAIEGRIVDNLAKGNKICNHLGLPRHQ